MNGAHFQLPSHEQFAAIANTNFRADLGDGAASDFALVEVGDLRVNASTRSFSLLFRAPVDTASLQNVYSLTHEELGGVDLFLVPVKRDGEGVYFESVFNQLVT